MKFLAALIAILVVVIAVYADGPFCTQNGLGPSDMMMSSGQMNPKYMWGKSGGSVKVPVVLDHAYTHKDRDIIFGGLAELAKKTCVKFYVYKHPDEVPGGDYVYITKTKMGCWSYVGKQGGHQDLSLGKGCVHHRTVMHEMMHALGFSHEHVRADRDKYVQIMWENIQRGRERNFERKRDSKSDAYGPYDYDSIMHYDNRAFSKNGKDTIRPTQSFAKIGHGHKMSHWDAEKINRAYKCHRKGTGNYDYSPFSQHNSEAPSKPEHVFDDDHSFRGPNPLWSGPNRPPSNEIDEEDHNPHDHENEHDHEEADFSPFGPSSPFYEEYRPGQNPYSNDDY